jgi:predicted aldo/keto reductase-like oxidoreductase
MKYREACGEKVSALGFGTMRLPLLEDGSIDQEQMQRMTDYAMENGVNYYDTAYPYHNGLSELSIGKALEKYPRDSFLLADKFPGHQHMKKYDCKGIFEEQLCCVASDDHDAGSNRCEQENRDAFRPESISVCFDRDQMLRWTAFDRGRPVNT